MIPDISNLKANLTKAQSLRDSALVRLAKVISDIQRLEQEDIVLSSVGAVFQSLIDQEVNFGVEAVVNLQTEGLAAVFDDQDLTVRAQTEIQRGKVSVDLITSQKHPGGSESEGSTNDTFGGSVATVQSVLLRLIIVIRRGLRPLLLLDESLPAFDSTYGTNMGTFLSTMCKRLGVDILLVSHDPVMLEAADRAYRITKRNGHAKLERLK